jgi:hypothetical protein
MGYGPFTLPKAQTGYNHPAHRASVCPGRPSSPMLFPTNPLLDPDCPSGSRKRLNRSRERSKSRTARPRQRGSGMLPPSGQACGVSGEAKPGSGAARCKGSQRSGNVLAAFPLFGSPINFPTEFQYVRVRSVPCRDVFQLLICLQVIPEVQPAPGGFQVRPVLRG